MARNLALYNKFLVAVATAGASAISLGLIVGTASKWVSIGIAFVGALGVYAIPNKPVNEITDITES